MPAISAVSDDTLRGALLASIDRNSATLEQNYQIC
jgi:hypothetical protein